MISFTWHQLQCTGLSMLTSTLFSLLIFCHLMKQVFLENIQPYEYDDHMTGVEAPSGPSREKECT
jgi:hypothetical protein